MTEDEVRHHHKEKVFQSIDLNNSYLPISTLKVMSLTKANFQYLHHTTLQYWDINCKKLFVEIINAISLAVVKCTVVLRVCLGTSIENTDGYTYDYWMVSFTIYAILIYITNMAILVRSGQITWIVVFWIISFSVLPFLILYILFDTVISIEDGRQYILLNLAVTAHYDLACIAITFIVFYFEIIGYCA